jgi:DnaJ family protein C protein 17
MGDTNKDLEDLAKSTTEDFYELLGVAFDAPEAAIKKAYRKASIRYHPDKNPDNKDAADRFIYLGWARDILIDEKLKGEYDRARTRRREKALQDELLDGRRRNMIDELERREREVPNLKRKRAEQMNEAERREREREQEMQRLAEDTKRRRKELKERREKERKEEYEASFINTEKSPEPQAPKPGESAEIDRTVKVRFQREGETTDWDKDKMSSMFVKYGKIDSVVMGKDKKIRPSGGKHRNTVATVFITYTRLDHAHAAVLDGKSDYPSLESVSWVNGPPDLKWRTTGDAPSTHNMPSLEEVTMMRLKEAGKKQLEEQIRKREAAEEAAIAPSTPVSTPKNKSFRTSFGPSIGKGVGSTPLGTPKFSFSPKTPNLEEVTVMRSKQAEKKRLEEQIRKQEAAEEATV